MAMAPVNRPLGGLTVGAGGQMMTPEQVKIQREMAKSLMEQGRDASPVGHWSGALARALAGFAGGYQSRKANEIESAGVSEAMALANGAMGGGSVGGTASPVASALAGHSPTDGHDHSNMTAADWLTYSNQGATRNQPIAASLVEAMSFLPDLGITMDVYSGGQDAEGPNRVGSTRHDHGNAADVTFRDASGRMLDWNNPDDVPVLQSIVSTARANGVTGFGAGDDYMGAGRMHIGFGNPGVWGAGGSGDTAPDWLRQAFEGVQSAPAGAGVSAGPAAGNVSQIAAALAHPFLPESTRAVLQAQLGQQMQMQNASYEAQLQNQDPLRQLQIQQAQLELQAAQNPAAPEPIEINGQLVDPLTYEVIGDYRTQETPSAPTVQTFYDEATGQEYKAQFNPQTMSWDRVGGNASPAAPLVNVNTGENSNAFVTESDKMAAGRMGDIVSAANAIPAMQADFDRLTQLGAAMQTGRGAQLLASLGPWAEALGADIDGLGDLQAYDAIVARMAPQMRPAGSGASSDFDARQFLLSLPSIGNTPEGNALIIETFNALNQNKVQAGEIARRAQMGEISWQEAEREISNLPNPYARFNEFNSGNSQGASPPQGTASVQQNHPRPQSADEFNALPSGSMFYAPDGSLRRKP